MGADQRLISWPPGTSIGCWFLKVIKNTVELIIEINLMDFRSKKEQVKKKVFDMENFQLFVRMHPNDAQSEGDFRKA